MSETPPPDSARVKDIFLQAIDLPKTDRAAFLDRACGGDAELRNQVEVLLRAEDSAGDFLAGPTVAPQGQRTGPSVLIGTKIGSYKLLQQIGEGGFGEVFMADQESPVRRRVALKVIKAGMDSKQIVARFEAERQALAMMEHPNIARVFDAGATDQGLPFFVMELVKGVPITQYCDDAKLDIAQRLALFIPVCQAVQHAHQKGVIHRDIKPSNVLVANHDGVAVPKVIDFGIAKAVQTPLTTKTIFTEFRQMIGTPEYMSPEQAEFSSLDVDTRSDVYSLGVLLYELLAGAPPFDSRDLRSRAMDEMARIIREVDPPKPSTRLSAMETRASIAALRQTEPARLSGAIKGELDWIVMKCLEKDRSRRYDSPSALAADIARHVAGEVVLAGPPSRLYRFKKSLQRNRVAYVTSAIVLLALVAGLIIALGGLREARKQRDAAVIAKNQAIAAQKSEAEAREYEKQTDTFLTQLLTSVEPAEQRGKEVMVKELIDQGVQQLDRNPATHSMAEASLRYTFAHAYSSLGQWPKARDQLLSAAKAYETAKGPDYPSTLKVRARLGNAYGELGELVLAEQTLKSVIPTMEKVFGSDNNEVLTAKSDLVQVLIKANKLDEAKTLLEPLATRAKQIQGSGNETYIFFVTDLADLKYAAGDIEGCIEALKDALALTQKIEGEDHPHSIAILQNLANALSQSGRAKEAEPVLRKALALARKVMGENHGDTLRTAQNLALNLWNQGKLEEAKQMFEGVLPTMKQVFGEDHPSTLLGRSNYGLVLQNMRQLDEAEAIFNDVADRYKRTQGPDYPDTMVTINNIAMVKLLRNDLAGAERIWTELLPRMEKVMTPEHPYCHSLRMRLGRVLVLEGKYVEAEPLLKRSYDAAIANGIGTRQPGYALNYGDVLTKLARYKEALPILESAEAMSLQSPATDPRSFQAVYENLITCTTALGDTAATEKWKKRLSEVVPATLPSMTPATTQSANP